MRDYTTDFAARLRSEFEANPIKTRVCLPDGSLGVVVAFHDSDQGRLHKVRGIHRNGRFRALGLLSCWFTAHELRLVYYTADIRPDRIAEREQPAARNGTR
jgi:hypothetical protein